MVDAYGVNAGTYAAVPHSGAVCTVASLGMYHSGVPLFVLNANTTPPTDDTMVHRTSTQGDNKGIEDLFRFAMHKRADDMWAVINMRAATD